MANPGDFDLRKTMASGFIGSGMPGFAGPPPSACFINLDVDELVQPSLEECEAYAHYIHLPELIRLQEVRVWQGWFNESIVRPALHSLEMIFRMIAAVFMETRAYSNKDEWLRRLEALANSQLELISFICEGDYNAPTAKLSVSTSPTGSGNATWKKTGSIAAVSRASQESLLVRLASWKKAQAVVSRLHFAIEGHVIRMPFTLGLGEPNLAGKPILEYDKICTPIEVYAYRQSLQGLPEDHTLCTVHQMMEAWLVVANGLLKGVADKVHATDSEGAAKKCWVLERVWKLFSSIMDLLQVMDPNDFMRLKHDLAINAGSGKGLRSSVAAYCLRSTMLRTVTKGCKELRHLVPKVVGVQADPKGGPRLQEAVMELFHSHGLKTRGFPYGRPYSYHSGTIHLLQGFQAIEVAVRQFYFGYQQLVITVMGTGEYKGAVQSELSGADVLSQLYSEPPYFPSVDGAKTFLGDYWHNNVNFFVEDHGIAKAAVSPQTSNASSLSSDSSSICGSNEETQNSGLLLPDLQRAQQQMLVENVATNNTAGRLTSTLKTLA